MVFMFLVLMAACGAEAEQAVPEVASVSDLETTSTAPTATVADTGDDDVTAADNADDTDIDESAESEVGTEEAAADDGEVSPIEEQELALLDFSACMREQGFDDFPDLSLTADGSINTGAIVQSGIAITSPDFTAATDVCTEVVQGVTFAPNAVPDTADIIDQLFQFTSCLRDEGVDTGDLQLATLLPKVASVPEGSTRNETIAFILDLDDEDPAVNAGIDACAFHLAGLPGAG